MYAVHVVATLAHALAMPGQPPLSIFFIQPLGHDFLDFFSLIMTVSVLVVCLGNICRSPMGEAVLRFVPVHPKT